MQISFQDFEKIEMRVGTILSAEDFPKAKKPAYRMSIDFGPNIGVRRSSAQITVHYQPGSLVGRQVIAVVNFPPRQIADFISECLVLGLYDDEGSVVLLQPAHRVSNGCRVG